MASGSRNTRLASCCQPLVACCRSLMLTSAAASKICLPASLPVLSLGPLLQPVHWRSQLRPWLLNPLHQQHLLLTRHSHHQCLTKPNFRRPCLSNDLSRLLPPLPSARSLPLPLQQRARSRSWAFSSQRVGMVRSYFMIRETLVPGTSTHSSIQEHRPRRTTARLPIPARL